MSVPAEASILIDEYTKRHLYGRLELIFKNGRIVFIKKEETIVPIDNEEVRQVQTRETYR